MRVSSRDFAVERLENERSMWDVRDEPRATRWVTSHYSRNRRRASVYSESNQIHGNQNNVTAQHLYHSNSTETWAG